MTIDTNVLNVSLNKDTEGVQFTGFTVYHV